MAKKFSVLERASTPVAKEIVYGGEEWPVKEHLSLDEMLNFTEHVTKGCFDSETGEYRPEVIDFLIRLNTVKRYTDITIPESIDEQYIMVATSGVVESIKNRINMDQYQSMISAIYEKIRVNADAQVSALIQKMNDIANAFASMQKSMEEMFSGVNASDINNLISSIAGEGNISEKIMQAYMKQKDT